MSEPIDRNWLAGILATAEGAWQAFVVPTALAGWVVYKSLISRNDTRRVTEADRLAAYMNRLEARIVVMDAENGAARKLTEDERREFARLMEEARRDGMRGWDLARFHYELVTTLIHIINNLLQIAADDPPPERYVVAVKMIAQRMKNVTIPDTLEAPIPRPPDAKP